MKINQGAVLLSVAIALVFAFHYLQIYNILAYFFAGVGVARLNSYWEFGDKNEMGDKNE
jgi:Kef-type K+ transport system membrane component KefB